MTLTCWSRVFIRGRVVGPDGEAVKGVLVTAVGEGITLNDSPRGEQFLLGPLPAGSFSVRASTMLGGLANAEPVTVPAGTTDLVLKMRPGGCVAISVLDSRGNPAAGLMVWVMSEATSEGDLGVMTEEQGKAKLGGRPPGSYTLSAASKEGEFACARGVQVAASGANTEVELRLEPAARLNLRVLPEMPKGVDVQILQGGKRIGHGLVGGDPLVVVPEGGPSHPAGAQVRRRAQRRTVRRPGSDGGRST